MSFGSNHWLFAKGLACAGALALVGCGTPESQGVADTLETQEAAQVPDGTLGLPTLSQLQPLNFNAATPGKILFSSNNPETVSQNGVLFSTQVDFAAQRGDPNFVNAKGEKPWMYTVNAPQATFLGDRNLDSTCPQGAVRDIGVYIAHIMANNGYVSLGVTPTVNTTVEVAGNLAIGPWDTQSPDFVSNWVAQEYFFNPTGMRRVNVAVTSGRYNQVAVAGGSGNYIDGRLNIRIAAGAPAACFWVHTVAQSTTTAATQLPTVPARGNVAWVGWNGGAGYGRGSTVFSGDKYAGSQSFSLPGPNFTRGYIVSNAAQAFGSKFRYRDSAEVNFGNYGVFYDQSFTVTNSSTTCMNVRAEFVGYALVGSTERPTYDTFARNGTLSVFWNGPIRYYNNTVTPAAWSPVEDAIVWPTANSDPTLAGKIPPSIRDGIELRRVAGGQSTTFQFQFGVPGLISSPGAIVFTSEPC